MKNPIKHLTLTAIALVTSLAILSVNWADIAANSNLVQNGGFEEPVVTHNKGWNIFTSAQVSGWTIEWRDGEPCQSGEIGFETGGMLELQNDDVNLGGPNSGDQYAELDSDCNGPDNNNRNNEAAAVRIYQDLTTEAGATYEISFYLRKRPNTGDDSNKLTVKWGGSDVVTDLGAPGSWTKFSYSVTASGSTTRLELVDAGVTDSLGTFVDDVKVVKTAPPPPDLRLNLTAECAVGDTLYWRVTNENDVDIPFTWNGPGSNDGSGLAKANTRTYFTTQDAGGANTTIINWDNPNPSGKEDRTKAHNNQQCVYHVSFEKQWEGGDAPDLDGATVLTAQSSLGTATCTSDDGDLSCIYSTGDDLHVPFGETYTVNESGVAGWTAKEGTGSGFTGIEGFDDNALPDDLVYDVADDRFCESNPNADFPFNLEKFCTHTVVNEKEKPTAISLASFEVDANDGRVMILWETGTEIDNAGFNLYRAPTPDGPWVQVNSRLIAAEGDPVSGAQYNFVDTPGRGVFYYQLEDIDYYGVTTLHNPVEAQLGATVRVPWFRPSIPNFD